MKAWKSGAYSLGSKVLSILITTASLAILGRLITPEEFGIFGLAYAVYSIILPFLDLGLTPAYLKLQAIDKEVSNAFFTLNTIIGLLVSFLMFFSAPLIARFYQEPVLLFFIFILAISAFLQAMTCQPKAQLVRTKYFDKISFIRLTSLIIGTGVSVFIAYLGFGYWALIFRVIIEAAYKLILSIWFSKRSYCLVGLRTIFKFTSSLQFSGQILLGRILTGMSVSFSNMAVGKALNPTALGFYTRASALAIMPDAGLRTSLTTPALAHLARLKNGAKIEHYIALTWIIFLIAGIPCLLMIVMGDWLMQWLMGQQWRESGEILKWLGLWGLGKLYHGLGVIYHMNQKRMSRWIVMIALSIPLTYIIPLILLFQHRSLSDFAAILAITYTLFWVSSYFYFLQLDLKQKGKCYTALLKQIGLVFVFVAVGNFLRGQFYFYGDISSSTVVSLKEILIVSFSCLSITALYLGAVVKSEFIQIKTYFKR